MSEMTNQEYPSLKGQMPEDDESEIDLRELLNVLVSKIPQILICGFAMAVIVFCISKFIIPPKYVSTTKLYVNGQTSISGLSLSMSINGDYEEILKSRPVIEKVIEDNKLDIKYKDFLKKVDVTNISNTKIIEINVTDKEPYEAKKLCDDLASAFIDRSMAVLNMAETEKPKIIEVATIPEDKDSPKNGRNAVIGAFLGCILAIVYFLVQVLMNTSIKSAEDVEEYLCLPILAELPLDEEQEKRHQELVDKAKAILNEKKQLEKKKALEEKKASEGKTTSEEKKASKEAKDSGKKALEEKKASKKETADNVSDDKDADKKPARGKGNKIKSERTDK
ncbi:MAG: Wzz/FepE/Etk N-terminal domain-containing protein [Lachnospiraceae bacterium]|nr:Wzz/FepE/Etk N-terminal domain-containing protein [Lachnospiraceae bacterium]MEE3461031.1 Wzz/FepE/Etk N-terminal domain-containing protein [Lachnospiraceae bacterium]